jgi:hypothetical protein
MRPKAQITFVPTPYFQSPRGRIRLSLKCPGRECAANWGLTTLSQGASQWANDDILTAAWTERSDPGLP